MHPMLFTQIIQFRLGFFFFIQFNSFSCIYHTVYFLCAMSRERIFSHKLNHLRIINKLEYLPFCHFSFNCEFFSFILILSFPHLLVFHITFFSLVSLLVFCVDASRFITYMPDCRLLFCIQISCWLFARIPFFPRHFLTLNKLNFTNKRKHKKSEKEKERVRKKRLVCIEKYVEWLNLLISDSYVLCVCV